MKFFDNILDLKDLFDIFIFDAFGVFWNGFSPYNNITNTFETLKKLNKKIIILSNTTKTVEKQEEKYIKGNFIKGKHYDFLMTAGEYTKHLIDNSLLTFKNNKNPHKYYVYGKENKKLFEKSNYIETKNIKEADFIFISSISISNDEYNTFSDEDKKYFIKLKSNNTSWRTTKFDILIPKINKIFTNKKIPCFSSNPDLTAYDMDENDNQVQIITSGSVAFYLKNNGFEIKEFGKPLSDIYNFTLSKINHKDKNRICMVGDSLNTDIKGANNYSIKSILCLKTGNTANLINNGYSLEELIKKENVTLDYVINQVAMK